MKRTLILFVTMLAAASVFQANAQQNLRTAYFLDGYTYGYKQNPALSPERNFIAIPAVGNFSSAMESNISLSSFLFPLGDGRLTTFMNESISADDFLSRLHQVSRIQTNINTSLLAFGFRTGRSYHIVDLSFRTDAVISLPYSLFDFLKTSTSSGTTEWDLSGLGVKADSRVELAYGYSRPISDRLKVGARLKIIKGIARADIMVDRLDLKMNGDGWSAAADGKAAIDAPLTIGFHDDSRVIDYQNIELPKSIYGYTDYLKSHMNLGLAVDLGATWDFLDYFTASLAVNDFGFITWTSTMTAEMPGEQWQYDGIGTVSPDKEGMQSIESQLSSIGAEVLDMVSFEMTDEGVRTTSMLSSTIMAGLEARMPFYERLSIGILGTQRINGPHSWTEGRFSANVVPTDWLSFAASCAISHFGQSAGCVLNLHFPGFGLFMGMDSFLPLLDVTPQYIPINNWNTNISLGLNVAFGKAVSRYRCDY